MRRKISNDPVFGIGPGNYNAQFYTTLSELSSEDDSRATTWYMDRLQDKAAGAAHNDYLQVWAEHGTIAFGAFLLLCIALVFGPLFSPVVTTTSSAGDVERDPFRDACRVALVAMLITAFFSFPLHSPARSSSCLCGYRCQTLPKNES